jgi:dihydropteroate synthase
LGIEQLILDPGFGFGKRIEDNYGLLSRLLELQGLGCPLLVGLSRKSMIYNALNLTPEEALNGSTALHAWALERGADILRVHDVAPAVECVRLHQYLRGSQLGS